VLGLVHPAEHPEAAPVERLRANAETIYPCLEQT
jgi:hypothetical protein